MKCFIVKKKEDYSYMFIAEKDLRAFYRQYVGQIVVEAEDLQEALIKFAAYRNRQ